MQEIHKRNYYVDLNKTKRVKRTGEKILLITQVFEYVNKYNTY